MDHQTRQLQLSVVRAAHSRALSYFKKFHHKMSFNFAKDEILLVLEVMDQFLNVAEREANKMKIETKGVENG